VQFIRKKCAGVPVVSIRVISLEINGQYIHKIKKIKKKLLKRRIQGQNDLFVTRNVFYLK